MRIFIVIYRPYEESTGRRILADSAGQIRVFDSPEEATTEAAAVRLGLALRIEGEAFSK